MCNLYNVSTNQDAIRALAKALDRLGNMPPSLDVYPDYPAPIVRNNDGERELIMVRWGMPSSRKALLDAATKRADKLRAKGKRLNRRAYAFDQTTSRARRMGRCSAPNSWACLNNSALFSSSFSIGFPSLTIF